MYIPHTVLRDAWQLAKYLNIHKVQCPVQNVDRVDPTLSDAPLHSHGYAVAIALMATPVFFQQTRFYADAARNEIRRLLAVYKEHRAGMYRGVVHPIGSKPNNRSWTGFQCVTSPRDGYLTVFRELHNTEDRRRIALRGLPAGEIVATDLLSGETVTGAELEIAIPEAPGFRFLRYEVA